jgi:hypothetical protein
LVCGGHRTDATIRPVRFRRNVRSRGPDAIAGSEQLGIGPRMTYARLRRLALACATNGGHGHDQSLILGKFMQIGRDVYVAQAAAKQRPS